MNFLNYKIWTPLLAILAGSTMYGCKPGKAGSSVDADAAQKVYVAPG